MMPAPWPTACSCKLGQEDASGHPSRTGCIFCSSCLRHECMPAMPIQSAHFLPPSPSPDQIPSKLAQAKRHAGTVAGHLESAQRTLPAARKAQQEAQEEVGRRCSRERQRPLCWVAPSAAASQACSVRLLHVANHGKLQLQKSFSSSGLNSPLSQTQAPECC